MMNLRLSEIATLLGAPLIGADATVSSVGSDSRQVAAGMLFVALVGEHFDGHTFVPEACARGAAGALVASGWQPPADSSSNPSVAYIPVPDPLAALSELAAHWRRRFTLPVIAVTGSNGKTTVKEMIAACLRSAAAARGLNAETAVLATRGNRNNHIGVPLTVLELSDRHRYAVIELGMNHPGEIAQLARQVAPEVALVNNVQREHLEFMETTEAVARENASVFSALSAQGVAVFPADDALTPLLREVAGERPGIDFALDGEAAVRGRFQPEGLMHRLWLDTPVGAAEVLLRVPGVHNVRNALAASACAIAAGIGLDAVVDGLGAFCGVPGRQQLRPGLHGSLLIDDSYNANPDSVRAGIDVLAATPGRKVLVLGDMGEVGDRAYEFHAEIGGYAKSQGVDHLFAIGEHAAVTAHDFGAGAQHFRRLDDLIAAARRTLDAHTAVLIKGSRFMRMERVADALAAALAASPETDHAA